MRDSVAGGWTKWVTANDSRLMQALATAVRPWARHAFALAMACAGTHAAALDWRIEVTPDGELFPALELSQRPAAAPGGGNGLVSVRVEGLAPAQPLRLRIDTPGLRQPADLDATAPAQADTPLILRPRLDWDGAALRTLHGVRRQTLRATLEVPGHGPQTRSIEVRLHPLDDALYYVREGRDRVDLGWVFAAYVDPHAAAIDDLLARARRLDADFDTGDHAAAHALRRIGAVWAALEQRGVRYADGDPALSRGPTLWSQRVRRPDEVWRDRRANCLDGSVLLASVLERLDLNPVIVLLPGHAFVGFRSGGSARHATFLETTLLGAPQPSAANFAAARVAGTARWRRAAAKLDGRHGPDHALIDIGTARGYGIIPLSAGERASRNPARVVERAPAAPFRESGPP